MVTKRDGHGVAVSSVSAPELQAFMREQAAIRPGMIGHYDLREAMTEVVRGAQDYLAVVGSRSRDAVRLGATVLLG